MDWVKDLEENGYVYIEDVGTDNPDKILEDYVLTIAKPIAYLGLPMVMNLRPKPGFQPASYAGTGDFDMHTDLSWHEKPPKYLGMYCVQMESAGGGIPLLADGWKAVSELSEADLDYLMTEPVTFPPPDHIDYSALSGPIIVKRDGKYVFRFRYDLLTDPPEPVTNFFKAINKHTFGIHAKPGSIYMFDNDRMFHGRTGLKGGMESDRYLKRMYGDV